VPYLLTTVRADQHTALADIVEMFRPHRAMVTTADVGSIAFQDLMFDESRVLAAAAAARARGIAVTLTGAGVQVIGITAGSPAVGTLKPGDLITAIDGTPVGTVGDVGGVDLKGFGARRQGASLFIVPADELAAARRTVPDVKGVTSLSQALALLSGAA
jgi:PDZ domain-containing secreted protein